MQISTNRTTVSGRGVYTPHFQREEAVAMANGHGGARIGAGQKKKALSDKLVEGNPGKRNGACRYC